MRLQRRRSARHVSVQGVRRARPRTEARPRRRSRRRAVRHRPCGDARAGGAPREISGGSPRRASTGRTGTTTRSTTRSRRRPDGTATPGAEHRTRVDRHRRARDDGPPSGHDAGRRSRTCCSTIAMVERFHVGSARQGDRTAAPGAHPAARAGHAAAAARSDARVDAGRRRRRPPLPLGGHAVPARGVSVERQLRHDRHQRRRRLEPLPRTRRHARSPRRDARSRAASSSTCATSGPAPSGRRRRSPSAGSRRTTS